MPLLRMREDLHKIYSHRIYFVSHFLKQGDGKFKAYIIFFFFPFLNFRTVFFFSFTEMVRFYRNQLLAVPQIFFDERENRTS